MKKLSDKELVRLLDDAVLRYKGNTQELRSAIGVLVLGRHVGWKPLYVMVNKDTVKKYQRILDIDFRDVLPETGPRAEKSVAWLAVQKVSNFWKAVKDEIPGIRSPDLK